MYQSQKLEDLFQFLIREFFYSFKKIYSLSNQGLWQRGGHWILSKSPKFYYDYSSFKSIFLLRLLLTSLNLFIFVLIIKNDFNSDLYDEPDLCDEWLSFFFLFSLEMTLVKDDAMSALW